MTTTTTIDRTIVNANGLTPLPFTFQAISDVEVGVLRNGVEQAGGFNVALNGDGTGTITPLDSWGTDEITIFSDPSFEQPANFDRFAAFYPDQLVPPLDRLARVDIALKGLIADEAAEREAQIAAIPAGPKGDPGGNILAIGLFVAAAGLSIPLGTDRVQTSGYSSLGVGGENYVADAVVDAAYVAANPSTSFISANGRGFRTAPDSAFVRGEAYGVSALSTDNYAAIQAAKAVALLNGKTLKLPAGTLIINQAAPQFLLGNNEHIRGSGLQATTLHFTGLGANGEVFQSTGKSNIRIENLKIFADVLQTNGQIAISLRDSTDCLVADCTFDKWTNSCISWPAAGTAAGPIPPQTTNARNQFVRCVSLSSRQYGFFQSNSTACDFLYCKAYGSTNYDGIKTGGGTLFAKIIGCHSEGNAADGFDTYDGFIHSVMADCTSYNNGANGFQLKGTFGGSYAAGDYVTRESAFSNLIARGNGLAGFLFQETRMGSATGLVASGNGTSGFILNNCYGYTLSACAAFRNTQHGWSFIGNSSRCVLNGCLAIDNSYVDGVVQNGTYDGFNFSTASGIVLNGCTSTNGTTAGKLGGQGYAYNTGTTSGIRLIGCVAGTSVTGPVGGTNPYQNNSFVAFEGPGTFLNFTPQVQAIASAASVTPSFTHDVVKITALAVNLSLQTPTLANGQTLDGKRLTVRIKDNGTSRTIAYAAGYRAVATALPTATVAGKWLYLDMIYNADDAKWDVITVAQQV